MAKRVEAIVEHQYSFSPERVFDCWIRPESIRLWMGAALQTVGLPSDLGLEVLVLDEGFEYAGEKFKSLSGVAQRITGSHCNGYLFFNLKRGGDR